MIETIALYLGLVASIISIVGVINWNISWKRKFLYVLLLMIASFFFGIQISQNDEVNTILDNPIIPEDKDQINQIDSDNITVVEEISWYQCDHLGIEIVSDVYEILDSRNRTVKIAEIREPNIQWLNSNRPIYFYRDDVSSQITRLVSKDANGVSFKFSNGKQRYITTKRNQSLQEQYKRGSFPVGVEFMQYDPRSNFLLYNEYRHEVSEFKIIDLDNGFVTADGCFFFQTSADDRTLYTYGIVDDSGMSSCEGDLKAYDIRGGYNELLYSFKEDVFDRHKGLFRDLYYWGVKDMWICDNNLVIAHLNMSNRGMFVVIK